MGKFSGTVSSDVVCRCWVSSACISLVMYIFLEAIKLCQVLLYYYDLSNKDIFWYLRVFFFFCFFVGSETYVVIRHSSFTVGLYMGRHK